MNCFTDLADACGRIESWRKEYNTIRPHSSLQDVAPAEFAGRFPEGKTDGLPLLGVVYNRRAGQILFGGEKSIVHNFLSISVLYPEAGSR